MNEGTICKEVGGDSIWNGGECIGWVLLQVYRLFTLWHSIEVVINSVWLYFKRCEISL